MELLDSTERLMEAESQVAKLQTGLDNVMKARVRSAAGLLPPPASPEADL